MKKTVAGLSVVLLLFLAIAGPASAQSRFGLKLGGGLSYIGGGDINAGLQGFSDLYAELYDQFPGVSVRDGYAPFHLGMSFNGEVLYMLSPNMAVGLGAGYFGAAKESSLILSDGSDSISFDWKPSAGVIPITLNFHYYLPAGDRFKIVLTAGGGMYLAKLKIDENFFDEELTQLDLSSTGFGAHAGLGLEIGLSSRIALTLDLIGRFAKTGALTGDYRSDGDLETGGTLWYAELDSGTMGVFPLIIYSVEDPTGDEPTAREAKLDLSGFAATIGILIRL